MLRDPFQLGVEPGRDGPIHAPRLHYLWFKTILNIFYLIIHLRSEWGHETCSSWPAVAPVTGGKVCAYSQGPEGRVIFMDWNSIFIFHS